MQWDPSMRKLIALGVKTFVEVGPGTVLSGLLRQIDKAQTCFNVEERRLVAESHERPTNECRTRGLKKVSNEHDRELKPVASPSLLDLL